MPSFETLADIFIRLSVFDSPEAPCIMCAVPWGDIMSTVGGYLEYRGGVQYRGGIS